MPAWHVGAPRSGSTQRLGPLGELPARADEVTGVPSGVTLQIILVLGFGLPEIAGGRDLGYDLSRPKTGGVDVGDRILGDAALRARLTEGSKATARDWDLDEGVSRWFMALDSLLAQGRAA